ncbi:MAG: hypothetical protein V4813_09540 [Gemmatimonadota bacterium]
MTETQERFLRTVLSRIALDSVVELHLFPPIRRGTMETGVAVIATVLPAAPLTMLDTAPDVAESGEPAVVADVELSPYADEPADLGDAPMMATADEALVDGAPVMQAETEIDDDEAADREDDVADVDEVSQTPAAPVAAPRLRILTAAYRHTIKGVERGKWVVDVQEEADAPLEAVEAVLRGVRHRSSEPADPEQVSHDTLAALVAPARVAPAA